MGVWLVAERPGAGEKLKLQETGGQDEQVAEGMMQHQVRGYKPRPGLDPGIW